MRESGCMIPTNKKISEKNELVYDESSGINNEISARGNGTNKLLT